jgi:hypothetical protein
VIIRTYGCADCGYLMEVELRSDQWDQEPPPCPQCAAHPMNQEFKPVAIGGSARAKAVKIAETIASEDYNVADFTATKHEGSTTQPRYKDQTPAQASAWLAQNASFAQAAALGHETRSRYGDGLDILQRNLKTGEQPDLIELSKRRSIKVW